MTLRAHTPTGPGARPFPLQGRHAFLIGIGGCGMSGLARMLRARGAIVRGSDMTRSPVTDALVDEGFEVGFEQGSGTIPGECNLVIASAAIKADHPQALEATERGLPLLSYAEALGRCMEGRTGVAIAGTHGKSTTAAMLGHVLIRAGLDPTVIVGATCAQLGEEGARPAGFRIGAERIPGGDLQDHPGLLVAEACEYNRSFHNLRPVMGAITSIEADHLDVYGSLDAVVEAFHEFARLLPPLGEGGRLFIAHDGAHRREVTGGIDAGVETIGFPPAADWQVTLDARRRLVGLLHRGEPVTHWTLGMPGDHMALDSAFAAVMAIACGADASRVGEALSSFRGLDRRLQFLGQRDVRGATTAPGTANGVRVYDDYGHHPTEVDKTLRALREYERPEEHGGRLICVFQPHQHSRTRFLLDEFAQSFTHADIVIVPHIYFVRDSEIEKSRVSATDLVDRLRERGVHAIHLYPFDAIVEQLESTCRPGDLLVVMGAGPVWQVAHRYIAGAARHGSRT